jgi:hypothetical protein
MKRPHTLEVKPASWPSHDGKVTHGRVVRLLKPDGTPAVNDAYFPQLAAAEEHASGIAVAFFALGYPLVLSR